MAAETRVFSNTMLLASIMDRSSSQELLQHRRVCKLWRAEANRLICTRQEKFLFSPSTKTKSAEAYNNDPKGVQSWQNVLQISFVHFMRRGEYIRASRRLLDKIDPFILLEASTGSPQARQVESSYFQELEHYYQQDLAKKSPPNPDMTVHCKMAGSILDQLTDFIESISTSGESLGESGKSDETFDHQIFPHLNFRFEGGRLQDCRDISRFFKVIGHKIRYLTVHVSHMRGVELVRDPATQKMHQKWDHKYEVFRQVPNLQVLTLVIRQNALSGHLEDFNPDFHGPPTGVLQSGISKTGHRESEDERGAFHHLKCLRLECLGDKSKGHFARWILLRAKNIHRIVYELGVSPCLLPFLSQVNYDIPLTILPTPLRLITPITTLCLNVFEDEPQVIEFMAQVINIQQSVRGQNVKALNLSLNNFSGFPFPWKGKPYDSPIISPLMKILKALAPSLEVLSLKGGAGLFLEGLIQKQLSNFDEDTRLQNFPNVRTLKICREDTRNLNHQEFHWSAAAGVNLDPSNDLNLTSSTTLSKVFPRLAQLDLDNDSTASQESRLWMAFLPHRNLYLNDGPVLHVDEVTSLQTLRLGYVFPKKALDFWKFTNLETLCLKTEELSTVAPAIWAMGTLQSLIIKSGTIKRERGAEFVSPKLEATITGLSGEVIEQLNADLCRIHNVKVTPECDVDLRLTEKRAALWSLMQNVPSIINLRRKLARIFKTCYKSTITI